MDAIGLSPDDKPAGGKKWTETVRDIKEKLPTTRIIVLGPVPRWHPGGPSKTIYQSWLKSSNKKVEPSIMQPATLLPDVEEALKGAAEKNGAEYVSPADKLCQGSECISRVGPEPTDMISKDCCHLSKAGSEYLIEKLKSTILP